MSNFAATPREARGAFISVYPFELVNGGLGVSLAPTGTSSRTALVGEGPQAMISNLGGVAAHLAFGDSSIVASTSYVAIMPGIPYTLTIGPDVTHVAGITAAGTTTVQISRGYGN